MNRMRSMKIDQLQFFTHVKKWIIFNFLSFNYYWDIGHLLFSLHHYLEYILKVLAKNWYYRFQSWSKKRIRIICSIIFIREWYFDDCITFLMISFWLSNYDSRSWSNQIYLKSFFSIVGYNIQSKYFSIWIIRLNTTRTWIDFFEF